MNRATLSLFWVLALAGTTLAAPADMAMDRYFSIWANDARITPETVDRLYASHVVYYGKAMTPAQVLRDKQAYIRQWPQRRYAVIPGSVSKTCDADRSRCQVSAILSWEKAGRGGARGERGANTIRLTLVREGGALKIARESGEPVVRSSCRAGDQGWRCSAYR